MQNNDKKGISYNFFYWGPLLCRLKLHSNDLKKFAKLCSKKSSFVNETLAGVIKNEHHINTFKYSHLMDSYLQVFQQNYRHWYGVPLTQKLRVTLAWVNFMTAGEFNPPHIHAACDFSSVLFIKVPKKLKKECKKFTGTGGGPGALTFIYGQGEPYYMNQKSFFPEEGDLFIFPATLTHFVSPFMCNGERISISANFKLE